ncbi:helix-turn-helix transcriptional regulator [Pseudoclavibacter sp. CFCC 13796]|uniref:ArsR/SmtB family transcription factor n=1 Tax=Pseudoclavibacter sp. CFCC 13796 TaxID=2615179 RepID=UPI00130163DE|nr:metalloregulator ArsR/SmtB family transcription factor [Pseudoclavibacter sp. CFCC 13796]KAB1660437.1 helix-turn-helix transcriptional regulator [Pseudoclavibacter sp. CFCC 13796]
MSTVPGLAKAAQLFKVLGNESRLDLLVLLGDQQLSVGKLTDLSGLSQPLVSQHLRTLKQAGLVTAKRDGKTMNYRVADHHVSHVIADALIHVQEPAADSVEADESSQEEQS